MKEVSASVAKAHFSELLREVKGGETLVITHHGKPVAHLTPVTDRRREEQKRAMAEIEAMRAKAPRVTVEEILAWRDEGRR